MALRSGGGSGGGDTGDSFLGQIDTMMGAPALQSKGGKSGKDGDGNFVQGLFQALGIGNKKVGGDTPTPQGDKPAGGDSGAGGDTMGGQAAALADSGTTSAAEAGGSGDLLKTIFSVIGSIL